MIDGSGTINPAALNTPGNFPSSQSSSLGRCLPLPLSDSRNALNFCLLYVKPRGVIVASISEFSELTLATFFQSRFYRPRLQPMRT